MTAVIRTIRRPVTFAVVVLASLVLTACGSGPSQVGSAAIIGDRAIALDDVQAEIRWLLDNVPQAEQVQQQGKLDQLGREVVRSRVVHELVTVAARREGLRADPAEVDSLIKASGGVDAIARSAAIAPERVRRVATDQVLLQQLGERYRDRLSVRYVGAMVTESSVAATARETARALGEKIAADPGNAERIIRDSGHRAWVETLSLEQALTERPELGVSALFGAREGSVVVIQPSRQRTGWLVALVRERTVTPGGTGAAAETARSARPIDPRTLYQAGLRQLQPIADELGVRLNPRYGVWDTTGMAPAPSTDELTGYQLESRTVQP